MDNNTREVTGVVEKYGESLVYSTNNIANAIFIIAAVQIVLLLLILWRVW